MKVDLAKELYRTWRESSRKSRALNIQETPREKSDDPQTINSVIAELVTARQWQQGIADTTSDTRTTLVQDKPVTCRHVVAVD